MFSGSPFCFVSRLDKGNALQFLFMGPEKGEALFQPFYVVHYARTGIARMAHPSTKRPSLVTVIEVKSRSGFTAALTQIVGWPGWAVFL